MGVSGTEHTRIPADGLRNHLMKTTQPVQSRERVLLVGVSWRKASRGRADDLTALGRDSLAELEELAGALVPILRRPCCRCAMRQIPPPL